MKVPSTTKIYSPIIDGKVRPMNLDFSRDNPVTKIIIHAANEVVNAETLARRHNNDKTLPEYHYYIDSMGQLWQGLPENFISTTSGDRFIDEQSIAVLLSNSYMDEMLPVSEQCIEKLIDLVVDVSRRNNFLPKFDNTTKGTVITHNAVYYKVNCPGPFVKAKLHEVTVRAYNRIHGLPDAPFGKEKGAWRVRSEWKNRKSQVGIYRDFSEACMVAYRNKKSVFDKNGTEVFNYKLSSIVETWDANAPKEVGDLVRSLPCFIDIAPGSNKTYVMRDGVWKMYVPGLGGLVPMDLLNLTEESKKQFPDHSYHAKKTTVVIEEGLVQEVDREKNLVKVHDFWFPNDKLIKKRRA